MKQFNYCVTCGSKLMEHPLSGEDYEVHQCSNESCDFQINKYKDGLSYSTKLSSKKEYNSKWGANEKSNSSPDHEEIGVIMTNPPITTTDGAEHVHESVKGDPKQPLVILEKLVSKLSLREVCPLGGATVDENSKWVEELKNHFKSTSTFNLNTKYNYGFVVEVTNIANRRMQRFYVRGTSRQEAGANLKSYLKKYIEGYNQEEYLKDYKDLTTPIEIARVIINEVKLSQPTSGAPSVFAKSSGVSADFRKKD